MFPSRKITVLGGDKFRDEHSMYFDGTDDSIHFPNKSGTFSATEGDWHTVCCWSKNLSGFTTTMRLWNANVHDPGFLFASSSANWKIGYNTGASEQIGVNQKKSEWDGVWKHTIMSFEVSDHEGNVALDNSGTGLMMPLIWIDGVSMNTVDTGGVFSVDYQTAADNDDSNETNIQVASPFAIGSNKLDEGTNSQPYAGWISDISVYKVKFTDDYARTVYNSGEPFDHNNWTVGRNYCTLWGRMGDAHGDSSTVLQDASLFNNEETTAADGAPYLTNDIPS